MYIVYAIVSGKDGRIYIGFSVNIIRRLRIERAMNMGFKHMDFTRCLRNISGVSPEMLSDPSQFKRKTYKERIIEGWQEDIRILRHYLMWR